MAWGPEGHAIVGRIAMRYVTADVRKNVLQILGTMPIDTAANWMDIMKSNSDYEFMRPWHYLDFPKGQPYQPGNQDNILNRLTYAFNELKHKKVLCEEQVRFDLFVLLHLMGDLHMPLHTGYEEDLGGNKVMVQYDTLKTHNLHWFWDEDIIRITKITDEDCLAYYTPAFTDSMKAVDFAAWVYESRSLLDGVYDFPDYTLSETYLLKNKELVKQQLLKAGLRLAFMLNKLFYSAALTIDYKAETAKYKNGIDINDAAKNIGKKVTIVAKVYGVKVSASITQISLHEKFPNSPLTVIIFAKNYSKFKLPLDEMFTEKNICVKGVIEEYKGKPQIIIEDPEDIIVLE